MALSGAPSDARALAKAARALAGALLLSGSIRRDAEVLLIFYEARVRLLVEGSRVRNLREDEESSLGLVASLLSRRARRLEVEERLPCIVPRDSKRELAALTCDALSEGFAVLDPELPPETTELYCDKLLEAPAALRLEELIALGNMVMDLCAGDPRS
ncbi:MAG: hypothetical protein QXU52_04300 [Fervidicoccaceae archaeon]